MCGKAKDEEKSGSGNIPVWGPEEVNAYCSDPYVEGPGIIIAKGKREIFIHRVEEDFWPLDIVYYVRVDVSRIDIGWIYWSLMNIQGEKMDIETIRQTFIPCPPIWGQRKISGMLDIFQKNIEMTNFFMKQVRKIQVEFAERLVSDKLISLVTREEIVDILIDYNACIRRQKNRLRELEVLRSDLILDPSVKRGISVRMLWRQKVAKKRRRTRWVCRGFFVIPFGPNGSCRKPRLTDGSR